MKKGLPEYGIGLDIFGPSIVILFSQETNPICKCTLIVEWNKLYKNNM